MQQIRRMMRIAPCLVLLAAVPIARGVEPLHVTLTDVEKNIYVESLHLASDQVTPIALMHGPCASTCCTAADKSYVEVIDVDNGQLRSRSPHSRHVPAKAILGRSP